jgi:hypothetical protein
VLLNGNTDFLIPDRSIPSLNSYSILSVLQTQQLQRTKTVSIIDFFCFSYFQIVERSPSLHGLPLLYLESVVFPREFSFF